MALVALTATPVAAAECLLDTKNDGVAAALDTDGDAASSDPTALACGFASPSHFNRRFREAHGATPGQYRAALKAS